MATGYAVCGIVILTGIILVKAVARSTEKAASKAVKDVFGPPQANGND
jgi:hypothetical protein